MLNENAFVSERAWDLYIKDMLQFSQRVILYTDGFDQDRFVASGLNYDATLRNLEMIGEAASQLAEAIRINDAAVSVATNYRHTKSNCPCVSRPR